MAICGAFCYAELATMLPRSSGEYNFLRRIYHPAFGFVAGWLSATVGFAAPIALAAMAFGIYFKAAIIAGRAAAPARAAAMTWLAALVHLGGVHFGGAYHNAWTALKLALIVVFIVAGFAFGDPQPISFTPSAGDLGLHASAPFAISLVFVMYSYSGWNAATYIAGELRDPARNLPRALFIGTALVIVLYVALNAVFLATTPIHGIGRPDRRRASSPASTSSASSAARFVGALICLGLVSSISAMTWIGPRVTMTMGEDIPLLRLFSRRSKNDAPAVAIVFQLLVAEPPAAHPKLRGGARFHPIQPRLSARFSRYLALIKMRITHPELPRPYRAWGYPITPLIFLSVTLFMMYYLVVNRPLQSLAGVAMMSVGLVIYFASRLISNVPASDVSQTVA